MLLYYDPIFLQHDTGQHPENAARLNPIVQQLNELDADVCKIQWNAATSAQLELVHDRDYVAKIKAYAAEGGGRIEQDTVVSERSFEVAVMAAGAICDAVEKIHAGQDNTAFCLVRPPGHHALKNQAMGFCLFNNVAVGAKLATTKSGIEKVLIVDWDVHHGNGTQAIFWEDPQVAFFSMHRDPFYPGTGSATETGAGDGLGTTRNVPIQFGTSRETQLDLFERQLTTFCNEIEPHWIFISAGFDAHKDDPIGSLGLHSADFGRMSQIVIGLAERYSNNRIISVLEGGYNPHALAECIGCHLAELGQTR